MVVRAAVKVVTVLPFVDRATAEPCIASYGVRPLVLVDNTRENLGIMASNNIGIDEARAEDADWFCVMSAAVRFGEARGADWYAALDASPDHAVVSCAGLFGWHLIAFSREVVETCGRFDQNFFPYGYDDNDYAIRIHKAFPRGVWSGIKGIAADDSEVGMGHSIRRFLPPFSNRHQLDYFAAKWGGEPRGQDFTWFYDTPFNAGHPVGYWPDNERFTRGGHWDRPYDVATLPNVEVLR